MRTLFLFFLGINVLFFVWQSSTLNSSVPPSKEELTAIPANVHKLELINENNPSQTNNQTQDDAVPSAAVQPHVPGEAETSTKTKTVPLAVPLPEQKRGPGQYECFTMGPFKEVAAANPIALKLRGLGAITHERQHDNQVPSGYWVYIPPFKSWKDARRMVVKLEKNGVRDMFIMGRGTMQYAVSAGLYTTQLAAKNRQSQLTKLGANAKIQTQHTSTPEYWIDIDVETQKKQVISAIDAIAKGLTTFTLMPRKCDDK